MPAFVSGLSTTAVKSTRIVPVERIELDDLGARGDRAFCVIDDRGRMVNTKRVNALQTVCSSQDDGQLVLSFPDGTRAAAPIEYGETLPIKFFSRTCKARLMVGPWSDALSEYIGRPLRIVQPEVGVDRGRSGGVSVISRASVHDLAERAGAESLDMRRFRMLIEIDGVSPYEEDSWIGREVRIGPALVAVRGNVGRCLVTGLDPESAIPTLPTLDLLGSYRRAVDSTEPLPFGIYGEVLEPGPVSIGDPVAVDA